MVKGCAVLVLMLVSNGCELIVDDGARSVEPTDAREEVTDEASRTADAAPDVGDAVQTAQTDAASVKPDVDVPCPVACASTASACAKTCLTNLTLCNQCPGQGCQKPCPKLASDCRTACMVACMSCFLAPACAMSNDNVCSMATMIMPMMGQ